MKMTRRFGRHAALITLELAALVAVVIALTAGIATWRLRTGPLDVGFASGYIEHALKNSDRGTYVTIGDAALEWPDLSGPLIMNVQDLKFFNRRNRMILSMDRASIHLSKPALLIGQIVPTGLVFEKPEIYLVRRENGTLSIGVNARRGEAPSQEQRALTARILQYVARPGKTANEDEPLAKLQTFEVKGARLRIEDRKTKTSFQFPSADFIFRAQDEGLTASFYETFAPVGAKPSFVRAALLIPWDSQNVYVKFEMQNIDINRFTSGQLDAAVQGPRQSAFIDAGLVAILDGDLDPVNIRLLAKSTAGRLALPGLYDHALSYRDMSFKALYNGRNDRLIISDTRATLAGVAFRMDAALKRNGDNLAGPLMVMAGLLPQEKIPDLWPSSVTSEKARRWLTQKISGATYRNLFAAANISLVKSEDGWDTHLSDMHAGFDFENMKVDYRPPMIPVTQGKGRGVYDRQADILHIDIDSATLGTLQAAASSVEISNLINEGPGAAALDMKLSGPLAGGLEYLSREPIHLDHDMDMANVQGSVKADIKVSFPTIEDIPIESIQIAADGTLNDVRLPGIMGALELSGGPYTISVKDQEFVLKGRGRLQGDDIDLQYSEFLKSEGAPYKNRITAKVTAGPDMLTKLGLNLNDFIADPLPVDVTYTKMASGSAEADININLTPVRLMIAPFNYDKKPGAEATASLKAKLENGILKQVADFKIKAPDLTVADADLQFSQASTQTKLVKADMPSFKIGDTAGKLTLDVDEKTGLYKIMLDANYFNLQPFLESKDKPSAGAPLQVTLSSRNMGMANDIIFGPTSIYIERNGQGQLERLEFESDSGKGPIAINYKPDSNGDRVFNMSAQDAGNALRAFGAYKNMRGGTLDVRAHPVEGPRDRNMQGKMEIKDFTVAQAPTLARLLGALSLPGVLSLLNNEGLNFTSLKADFKWIFKEAGSLIRLDNGRTAGNAMGFTFDGTYDRAADTVDVEGTIVPLSEVNNLIAKIPLVGDILTGGSDSIFAATYSIRGPAENPDVSVNPLAVLAPGILRRILFE